MEVLLNGEVVTDTLPAEENPLDNNGTDLVTLLQPSNSSLEAIFPNGISITVTLSMGLLAINSNIPPEFEGNVTGLLGNFNRNPSDDFTYRNGTMLDLSASDREIHDFGQSCESMNTNI